MKLCTQVGCGVCVNCIHIPKDETQVCRIKAEDMLDVLNALLETKLTQEQLDVLDDFKEVFEDLINRKLYKLYMDTLNT